MAAEISQEKIAQRILNRVGNPPAHSKMYVRHLYGSRHRVSIYEKDSGEAFATVRLTHSWFVTLSEAGHVHTEPAIEKKLFTGNKKPIVICVREQTNAD